MYSDNIALKISNIGLQWRRNKGKGDNSPDMCGRQTEI